MTAEHKQPSVTIPSVTPILEAKQPTSVQSTHAEAEIADVKYVTLATAEETITALLASADCLHPELPLTNKTEQNYLTQLDMALAKGEADNAAYSQLFTRLEAGNLSIAALYHFANRCYQHWQQHWPTSHEREAQQQEMARQTMQLQTLAQGRTLFRRAGTPTRYYWGQVSPQADGAVEKGLFFACYPTFTAQGEGVTAIYQAELITDASQLAVCEAYTQAQRRQQSIDQLLQHSAVLHQRLQQYGHHARLIVNLQLAWLYYRSGRVLNSLSIHESGRAVFYFRHAMGEIARHAFIQQQPPLPATLVTAAERLRGVIDQSLLNQAQQTLFAAQSAVLLERWPLCYQEPQLDAIYQLSQQTHALLTHAASVPLAAKQPLIDAWLAGFNRGLAGEDDQEVRVAMRSAVTRACNPVQKYPHSLATVHQWLLTMAQQLQQHGETGRVRALLDAYQQLLIRRQPILQQTIASIDQDRAPPYVALLATCEHALTELDQWLTTPFLRAGNKITVVQVPSIPASVDADDSSLDVPRTNHPTDVPRLVRGIQEAPGPCEQVAGRSSIGVLGHSDSKAVHGADGSAPFSPGFSGSESGHKEALQKWRQALTTALATGVKTHRIYADNTEFARSLLAGICREIEQQIGMAPCAYTLLGAGSFSRGEISPASDLDCALLVAEDTAKTHPWFRCFLQLLQWKLASLPAGVLSLESETLAWISQGFWFDTPQGFIQQHLTSQQPNDPTSLQQPENFGAQWFRWIYSSGNQPQEKDALLQDYQQRLQSFFHTPIGAGSLPAYQQLAPWSLKQHIGQAITPSRRQLSLSPKPADSSAKEAKESKHEVKAGATPASATSTFNVLNVKNLSYRLINAILCYGRFYDVPAGITTTRDVLAYLKQRQCLPASFITRLETALGQLYTWRLRQHWAWLHHTSELGENELILWPEDPAQQAAIAALPEGWRGFYLDKAETEQYWAIVHHTAEVIGRSVEGFTRLEGLAPFVVARHAVPVKDGPIAPSSSHTTTTTPATKEIKKEAKREVGEAEAQAIVAAQSRAVAETKSAAPSSAIHTFNPLAAAVEWTLQQLNKPKDRNATEAQHASRTYSPDPSLTWIPRTSRGTSGNEALAAQAAEIQTGSVEQAHVQWLAQVMSHCAEELPAGEPHSNDPICVKQDAEFRKHWQVYWTIPTAWRDMYIKQLRRSLTTKPDVIEPLANAPNKVGWRLSTQLGEQQWQQALRPLFAAEPQASLPPEAKTEIAEGKAIWVSWVEQGTIRWAPLRQECAKVVIDAKQQRWQPQHNLHGNHRLYALQTPSHSFWVKAYPEQPGTEYLVTALDRRLGVNGTPAQQLMALHHAPLRIADGTPQGMLIQQSAILLSQHVADAKYTLHRRIKKEPQFLEKLDFLAFAKTLLRVLLTNPEDDKGSDYFLVPLPGSDKYQLIRIDNERAFLPVTHLTQSAWSSQEDLQVKSILYCLDQMLLPWSSDPRTAALLDDLHQIQPSALIIDLLQDIEQQHTHWQQLLPESSIIQHASLQDPWMSIPTFMLPEGLESALLKRFTSLQTALRLLKPQAITGLKLLELVQPKLARYYNQSLFQGKLARDLKLPQANVQARFDHVAGRYYQPQRSVKSTTTPASADHQTSVASGPAVLSRQLSIALPELPKNPQEKEALISFVRSIWLKQAHSVQQALTAVATWQHLEAQRVMKGLLALRKEAQVEFGLLAAREQQQLLDQLLSRKAVHISPLTPQQQQFLLTALAGAQCHNLDLRPFAAVLTKELLLPILIESGQQLIHLDISGCTLLPNDIVKSIAEHASHLNHLRVNDQTKWPNLRLQDFTALTRFECNNASALTWITFARLPALKHLSLAGDAQLITLGDTGFGITASTQPWRLPKLTDLNTEDCRALRTVHLAVDSVENFQWRLPGCELLGRAVLEVSTSSTVSDDFLPALAAFEGQAWAQCNLGWCYENGYGVVKDDKAAVKWYQKAAEQGNAAAQYNLGLCYANGQGVVKDDKAAERWYQQAAEQGNVRAKAQLRVLQRPLAPPAAPMVFNPTPSVNTPSSFFAASRSPKPAPQKSATPMDEKVLGQLLKCVAEGEQAQAEALIKKDSKLLLAAGNVTDLSGRRFNNITAFQYALWAMDYHMWTMIQKYLPAEAQAEQYYVLESKGTAHGKHFDLQPLLAALKTYVDKFDGWGWSQREEQWCKKVGGAQKFLPAHVVNEYCRPDRPFDPCPTEWTTVVPRTRAVEIWDGSQLVKGEWFTPPNSSDVLGVSFAFYRGAHAVRGWGWRAGVGGGRRVRLGGGWGADHKSLQTLWNARTEQLKLFSDTLVVESQSTIQVGLK